MGSVHKAWLVVAYSALGLYAVGLLRANIPNMAPPTADGGQQDGKHDPYSFLYRNEKNTVHAERKNDDPQTQDVPTEPPRVPHNVLCTQQARLERIDRQCERHFGSAAARNSVDKLSDADVKRLAQEFVVSDSLRLLACLNWKTGTTTWEWLIFNNSLSVPLKQQHHYNQEKVFLELRKNRTVTKLDSYSVPEIRKRLATYYKFMTVRHPLDRLVSAYNNKIIRDVKYSKKLAPRIRKHMKLAPNQTITFEIFLDYIRRGGQDLFGDDGGHWHDLVVRCQPCLVDYDYVVRTETHNYDASYLVNHKMSIDGRGLKIKSNSFRDPLDGDLDNFGRKLSEYQWIDDGIFKSIVDHYRADLDIYGYNFKRVEDGSVYTECVAGDNVDQKCC